MKQKALEQLRSGKSLYGKDGAFAPLLKSFLDSALEAELDIHLDAEERLDNLNGFPAAIGTVFSQAEIQPCVVHQIRNSLKYVASKDQKTFMADLKPVYKSDTLEQAELRLDDLEAKWGKKYEKVIESWRNNWPKLTSYFRYDSDVRRLIYTTNTIEGFHRQVRKVTKTKGAFTSDMALLKLIYLAHNNISQKWTMPLSNWGITVQKLAIWFPDRMILDLN